MSVVTMQKFLFCGLENDRDRILKVLQKKGRLHLSAETSEDPRFAAPEFAEEKSRCEKTAQLMMQALNVLDNYSEEKAGLLSSLKGRDPLSPADWEARSAREEAAVAEAEKIQTLQKDLTEQSARGTRLAALRETLVPWEKLPVPLNYSGTESCGALIGALPGLWTAESVEEALRADAPGAELHETEIVSSEATQTCLMILAAREEIPALEDALRKKGFARPLTASGKTPAEEIAALETELSEVRKAEEDLTRALEEKASVRDLLRFCHDDNVLKAERQEALGKMLTTERVFVLRGFLPEKNADKVKEQLESEFACVMELSPVGEDEAAPVLLKNNAFAAPTEGVVTSYGMPGKGEIDPTAIMAVFYYFLFGLMLADAGYGLVMALGTFIVTRKYPNMGKSMKQMLTMFFWCGISTAFWGVMFGSYFGDAIPVIARVFFHKEITIPAVWLVPLEEPMKLLVWCFAFGLVHLFVGLGIKGYLCLKHKDWMGFIAGVLSWYLLLIGLILMLVPTDIFASIAGAPIPLPQPVTEAAKWMALAGAAGIVLVTAQGRKNPIIRVALGAYELYGATSWLSDVLSYSRLLALGLASGVIATVFNSMAAMLVHEGGIGTRILGAVLFAVVFLVGHVLNLAINLLGAYVHTNRLQYVEFFGKFYEGGGEEYAPLSAENTKFYHLEDN